MIARLRKWLAPIGVFLAAVAIAILEQRARGHFRKAREVHDGDEETLRQQAQAGHAEARKRAQLALDHIDKGNALAKAAQERLDGGPSSDSDQIGAARYRARARRLRGDN